MGSADKLTTDSEVSNPQKEQVNGAQAIGNVFTQDHQVTQNGEMRSIDRLTAGYSEVSKKEEVNGTKAIGESIENGLDDNKSSADDSDDDESPPFNFEFRGKQVGQTVGYDPNSKKNIRPPKKDSNVKNLKTEDELERRARAAADAKKKKPINAQCSITIVSCT